MAAFNTWPRIIQLAARSLHLPRYVQLWWSKARNYATCSWVARIYGCWNSVKCKKEDGNIHDRFACGVYLREAFISLLVNVGGGVYSRQHLFQDSVLTNKELCHQLQMHTKPMA